VIPGGVIGGSATVDPSYAIAAGTPNADEYAIHLGSNVLAGARPSRQLG
jgi:hypothetical protein